MAKIKINADRCKGCELCVINCPQGLIIISEEVNALGLKTAQFLPARSAGSKAGRRDKGAKQCIGCTLCAIVCPDCAIEVIK